jgi:hypothetical protein
MIARAIGIRLVKRSLGGSVVSVDGVKEGVKFWLVGKSKGQRERGRGWLLLLLFLCKWFARLHPGCWCILLGCGRFWSEFEMEIRVDIISCRAGGVVGVGVGVFVLGSFLL